MKIFIIITILILFYIFYYNNKIENYHSNSKITVSFTTIPSRLEHITETLNEIYKQYLKPDIVYINIPYYSKRLNIAYSLNDNIIRNIQTHPLNKYSVIKIVRCEDYGPATKILGCIGQVDDPNTIIITFDDDIVYEPYTISLLTKNIEKYNNSIVCLSAVLKPETAIPCDAGILPNMNILEGFGGVAYRRKFITNDILEYYRSGITNDCFLSDDLVLSAFMNKNNIQIIKVCISGKIQIIKADIDGLDALHRANRYGVYRNCIRSLEYSGFDDFVRKIS